MMKKKIVYVEPIDYFPKEIRKKYKLGEFSNLSIIDNCKSTKAYDVDFEPDDGKISDSIRDTFRIE
jgi:hypothetical protein